MSSTDVRDMTRGKPISLIIAFSTPLMFANMLQQLYTMINAFVIGNFGGENALAAIGAADWFSWLMISMVSGLAQGFAIPIAQCFGAGDIKGLKNAVAMSYILSGGLAVVLTFAALYGIYPILLLLKTPGEILYTAGSYLRILFYGLPITFSFNMLAAVLRALGNGKTPLYAVLVAAAVNVALDLLFVLSFGWGVAGAAVATVIAQCVSTGICLYFIAKMNLLKLSKRDFAFDFKLIRRLFALGIPASFQNAIISIGGMAVQAVINGYGLIYIAAFTAANKLYGLLEVAATSFGFSMATFVGQNIGAGKFGRIKTGMRTGALLSVATALLISCVIFIFGEDILSLFISGAPDTVAEVLKISKTYLFIMAGNLFILYLLHVYRSALYGAGNTVIPMVSGIVEFALRIFVAYAITHYIGASGLYFVEPAAWWGAALLLIASFYKTMARFKKTDAPVNTEVII